MTLCHCHSSIFKKIRVRVRASPSSNPKLMEFENKIFNGFKIVALGFEKTYVQHFCYGRPSID